MTSTRTANTVGLHEDRRTLSHTPTLTRATTHDTMNTPLSSATWRSGPRHCVCARRFQPKPLSNVLRRDSRDAHHEGSATRVHGDGRRINQTVPAPNAAKKRARYATSATNPTMVTYTNHHIVPAKN